MEQVGVYKSFTDLQVWKEARVLKNQIKQLTDRFPSEEKYRLSDQIIRYSRSVTSNISEGHGRFTYRINFIFAYRQGGHLVKPTSFD